jgi:hypothetical protein
MADTKISALGSGAPAQATDETVIARSGANYKLTVANIVGYLGSPITEANGGTGESTYTNGQLLIGNASSGLTKATLTAGSNITITNGDGAITIAASGGSGTVTSVSGAGTVNGLTLTGTVTSSGSLTLGGTLSVNLASDVTGTLPVANGGTGITSFGTGVATWLGTPSSSNLAAAVTDETGTGALVFANTPTLVTPVLGTPTSGNLSNCTADGTNAVGYRNVPKSGSDKTTSYSLATTDVGKFIGVGSGGSITIPDATFAAGDVVSVFNNTSGNITITCTITTAYIAGTDADKASVTLATRGVATILFLSGTVCVISGNVS